MSSGTKNATGRPYTALLGHLAEERRRAVVDSRRHALDRPIGAASALLVPSTAQQKRFGASHLPRSYKMSGCLVV